MSPQRLTSTGESQIANYAFFVQGFPCGGGGDPPRGLGHRPAQAPGVQHQQRTDKVTKVLLQHQLNQEQKWLHTGGSRYGDIQTGLPSSTRLSTRKSESESTCSLKMSREGESRFCFPGSDFRGKNITVTGWGFDEVSFASFFWLQFRFFHVTPISILYLIAGNRGGRSWRLHTEPVAGLIYKNHQKSSNMNSILELGVKLIKIPQKVPTWTFFWNQSSFRSLSCHFCPGSLAIWWV